MPPDGDDAPLILTLGLEPGAQERLDALRRRYFPPERNHLRAHVTLFHALPAAIADRVMSDVAATCRRQPLLTLEITGPRALGRGTALAVACPGLLALRAMLAGGWRPYLTAQDAGGFRPHVTIQNKVSPEAARALQAELAATFAPWTATATGLELWRYRGGPWEPVVTVPFSG